MVISSTKHERHVCWSEEVWSPTASEDMKPGVLPCITYIHLTGQRTAAEWFWRPLFNASPGNVANTYDAVAHFWFPNLKFILDTTCDGKQPVNLAWVSARNVQEQDVDCSTALEKLIVDSCAAKPAETSSGGEQATKSLQQLPLPDFRSHHDPKVWRELAKKGVKLQNSANKAGSPFAKLDPFQQASELSKVTRNVAALTFSNIGMISIHILCEFGLDYDLTLAIFRLFLLLNTLYKAKKIIKVQMMNFQLRVRKVESVSRWIDTMVEQEVDAGNLQEHAIPPYSLLIYIDRLTGAGCYYPFEKVLLEIRRKLYDRYSLNGHRLRYLPTRLDVMYKHDAGDPDAKRFAMDFGSKVKATFARFGIYHMHCNSFMPLRYYENGVEVIDEGRKASLFFSFEDHQSTAFAMEHTEILHPNTGFSNRKRTEDEFNMFVKPSVKPAVKSTTCEPTGIPFMDQHMDDIEQSLDAIRLKEENKKNKKARQKANKAEFNLQIATIQSVPSSNPQRLPATLLSLPAKLLKHIAGIVRETDIESLASLNACSKTLYAASLPILWKEVTWRKDTWKDIKSRSNGDPAGWQFTQYIHFSGKAPWFWKGLVDTLSADEAKLGSEEIVQRRWPELKAVVRTEALMNVEVPISVWLTVEGAEDHEETTNSPVAHAIRMAYAAWGIANSSPAIIPKFVTHFQPVEESFEKAYMALKPGPELLGRKRPDNHNRPTTTLRDFQSDPDATLEVHTVRVKRALDFHILSSLRRDDPLDNQADRVSHLGVILHIFSQVQQHFAPATLTFAAERSRTYLDVMVWLQMAGFTTDGDSGQRAFLPFAFHALLGRRDTDEGFLLQTSLFHEQLLHTLPAPLTKIEITDQNHPARPPPACRHASIDFRTAGTRKVLVMSQCYPGGIIHKGFANGRPMTDAEFRRWRQRERPDIEMLK